MMSFTAFKKEPLSMKLRVADMKQEDAQNKTKQLEEESRKMEERLRELKVVMNKEKEMREQRGGGYWSSGKTGNLSNHAKDILNKPPAAPKPSHQKARKIKVLKDEPLASEKPRAPPVPGTLAFLAQKDSGKPARRGGATCGQCDLSDAVVSCQECEEIYCAHCFTAFHLKGALAKHHSFPLTKSISANQNGFAPIKHKKEPESVSSKEESTTERQERGDRLYTKSPSLGADNSYHHQTVNNHRIEQPNIEHSLLDAEYNEEESAKAFQSALMEWRQNGDSKPDAANSFKKAQSSAAHALRAVVVASPVRSPRYNVDEGTSTNKLPDSDTSYSPEFHHTLSYAERLLVKQNRRTDLPPLQFDSTRLLSEESSMDDATGSSECYEVAEPINFSNLIASVHPAAEDEPRYGLPNHNEENGLINIEDVTGVCQLGQVEEVSHYVVQEQGDDFMENIATVSRQRLSAGSVISEAWSESHHIADISNPNALNGSVQYQPVKVKERATPTKNSPMISELSEDVQSTRLNDAASSGRVVAASATATKSLTSVVNGTDNPSRMAIRAVSRANRPSNGDNSEDISMVHRPSSAGSRSASRNNPIRSRPKTVAEKAALFYSNGILTKEPSKTLRDVISHYGQLGEGLHDYSPSMSDFFMAGVQRANEERGISPSKELSPHAAPVPIKKHRISDKVYSLSTKCWRPESSLAENTGGALAVGDTTAFGDGSLAAQPLDQSSKHSSLAITPASESLVLVNSSLTARSARDTPRSDRAAAVTPESARSAAATPQPHETAAVEPHRLRTADVVRPQPQRATVFTPMFNRKNTLRSNSALGSNRVITPILVDGDDMTQYDTFAPREEGRVADGDALDHLEYELASNAGRLTADGRISRLVDDISSSLSDEGGRSRSESPQTHRAIDGLRESMMDDFEETELLIMQDEAMRISLL